MKKILILFLLVLGLSVNGQESEKKLNGNLSFGVNYATFNVTSADDISTKYHLGFNFGVISTYKLTNNYYLRLSPGILFTQRDIFINNEPYRIESSAANISLQLKGKFKNNMHVFSGGSLSYDAGGNLMKNWRPAPQVLKHENFYFQLGYGVDLKKSSIELCFNFNPFDIYMKSDNYDPNELWYNSINKLYSNILTLNFIF